MSFLNLNLSIQLSNLSLGGILKMVLQMRMKKTCNLSLLKMNKFLCSCVHVL